MAHEGNEEVREPSAAELAGLFDEASDAAPDAYDGVPHDRGPLPPAPSGAPRTFEDDAEDGGWFVADEPAFAPAAPRAEPGPMPDVDVAMDELLAAVSTTWGFSELRPAQEEAMRASLAARDVLVIMPTGGGKSLCYQAPALIRPG